MNQTTKRRIAVVTDSTAYLPPELVAKYDIHVVPLTLIMGDQTWQDGVDIDPPAFYELLRTSSDFPTTSQPSVAAFQDLFTQLSQDAEGIVAVLISDKLSGTLDSARAAAANLPDVPIELVDSLGVSMMVGFPALAAAQAADAGGDLQTVASAAQTVVNKARLYFVVDTLEYLHRGGRIGAATKLLGSALNVKPIMAIKGVIEPIGRVRTWRKALNQVYELIEAHIAKGDKTHMAVFHVAAPDEAARFKEQLAARFQPVEIMVVECSPVIGAHAGPGAVGVAFYAE